MIKHHIQKICTLTLLLLASLQLLAQMEIVGTTYNEHCNQRNGRIVVSVTGGQPPYEITWNIPGSGFTIENLAAGNYTVFVKDATGTTSSVNYVIEEEFPQIEVESTTSISPCLGNDGSLHLAPIGTSPFIWTWSHDETLNGGIANNLSDGEYSVTLTDALGCTAVYSHTLESKESPEILIERNTPIQCNEPGSVLLSGNGVAPFEFRWSDGHTGVLYDRIKAGTYVVTMIDGNDCSVTIELVVSSLSAEEQTESSTIKILSSLDVVNNGVKFSTSEEITGNISIDYGDGTSSNDLSTVHQYTEQGQYEVTVQIENECTSLTIIDSIDFTLPPHLVVFDLGEIEGLKGDIVRIPLTVPNCPPMIASLQFGLKSNSSLGKILGIEPALLSDTDYLYNIETGLFSYSNPRGVVTSPTDTLIYIVVELLGERGDIVNISFDLNQPVEIGEIFEGQPRLVQPFFLLNGSVKIYDYVSMVLRFTDYMERSVNKVFVEIATDKDTYTTQSGVDGIAKKDSLPPDTDYSVLCDKKQNSASYYSTFGVLMMRRYILELPAEQIFHPAQLIAADVTCDGKISTFDLLSIQRVIVGLETTFPCPEYKFYLKDSISSDVMMDINAIPLPSPMFYPNVLQDMEVEILAIKTGDILGYVDPNELRSESSDSRSKLNRPIMFKLPIQSTLKKYGDNEVEFVFSLDQVSILTDFQMAIQFDDKSLELIEFIPSSNESIKIIYGEGEKDIKLSFVDNQAVGVPINSNEILFSIRFKTKRPMNDFSGVIWLNNTIQPIAHTDQAEGFELLLVDASMSTKDLLSIYPNPMTNASTIQFDSPMEEIGDLEIYSINGQLIYSRKLNVTLGSNSITLDRENLSGPQVYLVQIATSQMFGQSKLIVVE